MTIRVKSYQNVCSWMFQHAGIWQAGSHPPQIYGDYKFLGEIIWNMHAGSWGREGRDSSTPQTRNTAGKKFTTHSYTQDLCSSTIHSVQRGVIYTEHKPKCRLCKMCNPFFMGSESFRVCSSLPAILLLYCMHHKGCRQESWSDSCLAYLSRRRGARSHAFLMMEACKGGWLR